MNIMFSIVIAFPWRKHHVGFAQGVSLKKWGDAPPRSPTATWFPSVILENSWGPRKFQCFWQTWGTAAIFEVVSESDISLKHNLKYEDQNDQNQKSGFHISQFHIYLHTQKLILIVHFLVFSTGIPTFFLARLLAPAILVQVGDHDVLYL